MIEEVDESFTMVMSLELAAVGAAGLMDIDATNVIDSLKQKLVTLKQIGEDALEVAGGFLDRASSAVRQGFENVSDYFSGVIDSIRGSSIEESKLYEDILLDLMEASAKKQRVAQQPKKHRS